MAQHTSSNLITTEPDRCHNNNSSSNSIKYSNKTSKRTAAAAAAAAALAAAKALAAKPAAKRFNATTAAATTASGHDQASCSPSTQLGPAKSMSFKMVLGWQRHAWRCGVGSSIPLTEALQSPQSHMMTKVWG